MDVIVAESSVEGRVALVTRPFPLPPSYESSSIISFA